MSYDYNEFKYTEEDHLECEKRFNELMQYEEMLEGLTTEEKEDLQDSITRREHHQMMMDSWHY